jgi:hypothetical protein
MSDWKNKDGKTVRRNQIATQFAWQSIQMLESPAYRALSLSGHRIWPRIQIEHAQKATEDWRQIKTIGEATTIATSVRKTIKKKQNASRIKHHSPHRIKRSESPNFQSDKPDHYPRRETGSLSISRAASAAGAPVLPLSSKPKLVWSTPVLTEVFGAEKDELLTILAQIPIPIPGKLAAISGKFVQ